MTPAARRPRILQVFNRYLYPGGEQAVVERLGRILPEVAEVGECLFDSAEWTGPAAPPKWKQPFLMFENPDALRRLNHAHRMLKPDCWLLHNLFPVGSAAVYRLALDLQTPVLQLCHNLRPFSVNGNCWARNRVAPGGLRLDFRREIMAGAWQGSILKTAIYAMVLRRLHAKGWLHSVHRWIAISDFVRERFIEAGVAADKVVTLRHSWDLVHPNPIPYHTDGTFLYMGRLSVEKGVDTLLAAWQELGENAPTLNICGEGPMEAVVRRTTENNRAVHYHGKVDGERKDALLTACAAMLAPSNCWEALGLVAYEAFDYGKPVVAARSGGLPEVVADGERGWLHQPGNATSLAQCIRATTANPQEAARRGAAGRRWLENNTSTCQWLKAFDRIVRETMKTPMEAGEVDS